MAPARAARQGAQTADEPRVGASPVADRAGLVLVGRAELERRRLRRRREAIYTLAGLVVAAALLIVAAGQAFVAAQQVHLDRLEQQLATSVARAQNLQLARAKLESPSRILVIAERQLGMVVPKSVTYLVPVDPSRTSKPATSRSTT